ncbi:bifunctional hydroxymethylpyrimidine kinase/phosphomethylpyrimidine kinase [Rickettsiales endosymbiont of Peranema trichophorum]|uniref:bifunctional hydroxymethylpyrimidine kinase/phosphomethylpyrimidine kinase n=1 Tax=Rickettsiales endosymbiont of Peranema trichophorum TaxID=2486577 RepID=UPI001023F11C|nr:bifunctional hydroxymethylpyrimidine kinase/phosphomethylpyrimidine kinase [Rickettsiales endosymbiont of Peranema trichophorum]RZI45537.1 bifunctional hydroxymethylpyrimidine kinase/phosphomethylpyrimidine kinase [Rickettsiales endosymbiont of Peranema trichophorum]
MTFQNIPTVNDSTNTHTTSTTKQLKTALSIAGFDGSGGAGIQADLKTFSATGCYGMTVLTALPIQNTCGVRSCYDLTISSIQEQLQAIFDDIKPDAIKIGMLFSTEIIELVAAFLIQNAKDIPIVLDPVMVAKSGDTLLQNDAIKALKKSLIPIVHIITPNLPEAKALVPGDDKNILAKRLLDLGCTSVLLKGGHEDSHTSDDLFLSARSSEILSAPRIHSKNTHGTGCTLSAAIASFIGQGLSTLDACKKAKTYLHAAILHSKDIAIGKGHGPVHHFHHLWKYLPSDKR